MTGAGPLRIANCSGFYGDRFAAAREMLEGGPIDVLTGDYLSELTLFLLWRAREKDPAAGYAATFLRQMEEVLGLALERGVRIVTNAGGLAPAELASRLAGLAAGLGLGPRIAHLEGDDLLGRLRELEASSPGLTHAETGAPLGPRRERVVTANAYLGGWGIAEALRAGADVVVCGRVADASLVAGPAAWRFGWARDDWDRLAGAVAAGHVLECGAQASGGNYAFFSEVPGLEHPGFPLAEIHADGSAVITKHPGTGGLVSVGTVTAQLLYEIDGPRYLNPDVVARFDTLRIEPRGPDRVRISAARGEPAPPSAKVAVSLLAGYRNSMTFVLTGLGIEAKARALLEALRPALEACEASDVQLLRADEADPGSSDRASAFLRMTVKDRDRAKAGRAFSSAAVELALASYPGFYTTTPPGDASPYAAFWPALVPAGAVRQTVVLDDRSRIPVEAPPCDSPASRPGEEPAPPAARAAGSPGPTRRAPLGAVFGARSGDKGANANVGVWARDEAAHAWLRSELSVARFKQLLPETAPYQVRRFELPNLLAVNFVVLGWLGEGAGSTTRLDPQAKALGELLRARLADLPEALLAEAEGGAR